MTDTETRLRRLVADEVGECRDGDVAARLDRLDALAEATFASDDAAEPFAVLGNETRYRLARLLAAAEGELCVCELEPLVDVSESAVSHALTDLADAGLVERRKEGNWRYYRTTDLAKSLFAAADEHVGGGQREGAAAEEPAG